MFIARSMRLVRIGSSNENDVQINVTIAGYMRKQEIAILRDNLIARFLF